MYRSKDKFTVIRVLFGLFVIVALLSSFVSWALHVSDGVAFVIVVVVGVISIVIWAVSSEDDGGTQYVKTTAMWRCPYCLKRTKLMATACHHCGRSVVVEVPKVPKKFAPVKPSGFGVVDEHGRWTYQCTTREMAEREAERTGGTVVNRELDEVNRKWAPEPAR